MRTNDASGAARVAFLGIALGLPAACQVTAEPEGRGEERLSSVTATDTTITDAIITAELGTCPTTPVSTVGTTTLGTPYTQYRWDCSSYVPGVLTNATAVTGSGAKPNAVASTDASSGSEYTFDGYIDFPTTRGLLQGKVLSVVGSRPNYINNGNFGGGTSCTTAVSSSNKIGNWSSGTTMTATAASGDCKMTLQSGESVEQAFPARRGDVFTASFDFDGSTLYASEPYPNASLQKMKTYLRHVDSSAANLSVYYPASGLINADTSLLTSLTSYSKDDLTGRKAFKLRAADNTTVSASGIAVNQCDLTNLNATPTAPACGSISNLSVAFSSESGSGSATIDNVRVDFDKGIEIEILDATTGKSLQSSTIDNGFLVNLPLVTDHLVSDVTIRIHMRSRLASSYPTVRAMRISDAFDISTTRGSLVRTFSSERMGVGQMWEGPPSQVKDTTLDAVPTECRTTSSESSSNCYKYFVDKKLSQRKFFFDTSWLKATWNASRNDYDVSLFASGTADGSFYLNNRIAKSMRKYGYTGTMLILNSGSMVGSDGSTHSLGDSTAFPTHGVYASQEALGQALIVKYATYVAQILDGSHLYKATCDSGSGTCVYRYPAFNTFELFGEVNGAGAGTVTWSTTTPSRDTIAALANSVGSAIRAVRSNATVTTPGIHGGLSPSHRIFDSEFIKAITDSAQTSPPWSTSSMNGFAFHPYLKSLDPEELGSRWDTAIAAFSSRGWSTTLPTYFQEWGISHEVYDPHCTLSGSTWVYSSSATNGTWSRSWGKTEHGKLFARNTLLNLSLPVNGIFPYGVTTPAQQGSGNSTCTSTDPTNTSCYACWESDAGYTYSLFDRVAGTGPLEGSTTTILEANAAGKAYVTTAAYLSTSSPYGSSVANPSTLWSSDKDHYQSPIYKTGANEWVIAGWWFRDYLYGADWMNYMWGAADDGFTDQRPHNIGLPGFDTIASATLVPLDGGATSTLTVNKLSNGTQVIQGATFGERPVLIKLTTSK